MDDEIWPSSMAQFLEKQCTEPLGPSLGVDRMWTKWNDPKPNKCAHFLKTYVQKGKF